MELDTSTPARQRLVTDLLAWGGPRPRVPADLAARLAAQLDDALADLRPALAAVAQRRRGRRVVISRTTLVRSTCDGWQVAPEPFEHTWSNARGRLTRETIGADWARTGTDPEPQLVEQVWHEVVTRRPGDPGSLSSWLNALPTAEAGRLRAEVAELLAGFREVWPPLPAELMRRRIQRPVEVPLADGAVVLRGVPDLVLDSRHHDGHARALVVDVKTGRPRAEHDRLELRFAALLTTLASGRPPFRWATFYVTEGRSEPEDLGGQTLTDTARRVAATVAQLVRLDGVAPDAPEEGLQLRAGIGCASCRRRPGCSVAAADPEVDTTS